MVGDGRSYSDETFAKAVKILNSGKKNIQVDHGDKTRFEALAARLKERKHLAAAEEVSTINIHHIDLFILLIVQIRRCPRRIPGPSHGHSNGRSRRTAGFTPNRRPSNHK